MDFNLRLLQLGDSALPVGGYTHSWGLETAIVRRLVHDAATLERWCRSWLRNSLAPFEGVVLAAVCRSTANECWSDVQRANELVTASIGPPTLRNASREMGEQLWALAATWQWSRSQLNRLTEGSPEYHFERGCHYCVSYGVLGAFAGAGPEETLTAFLNQSVLGMIAAGVRGIPIGHTHAQQILAYLHDDIRELISTVATRELESAGSGAPYYEVLCHEQPRLYTRLFRS